MRKLTEEEIKKELSEIMDDARWGDRDFIFMKNLYHSASGMILDKEERTKESMKFHHAHNAKQILVFPNLEHAIRLGWVVD